MATFTIQHPLLVFYKVHRRTGCIQRSCVFTNTKPESVQLRVAYDFPEHSWVQIYGLGPSKGMEADGDHLELRPGDNEVLLSFNTDNFNFPDDRFRGRISFRDPHDSASRAWIEISFENILELQPFAGYAAIDLGTSTAAVSLFHVRRDAARREPWTPALEDDEHTIPSAVYIRNYSKFCHRADGGCLVGHDALRAFRAQVPRDPRCLQLSTKRLLGYPRILVSDEQESGGFIEPIDVLQALGRFVRERTQNNTDVHAVLGKVCITFPPTWNYRQISRWREVFRRLGFRDDDLDLSLDEASAAGLFYIYNCVRERDSFNMLLQDLLDTAEDVREQDRTGKRYTLRILSFDFGGGTMDLALIEARLEVSSQVVRLSLSLVGSDSLNYGGDQVTLAIFRILKRRLAMALCDPARLYQERVGEAQTEEPEVSEVSWLPAYAGAAARGAPEGFVLPDRFVPSWSWGAGAPGDAESHRLESSREVLQANWGYLTEHVHQESLEPALEDAVDRLFPTRFLPSTDDVIRLSARRNFDWLWERAEHLKKSLFNDVQRTHGHKVFPSFDVLDDVVRGISLEDVPDSRVQETISWHDEDACPRVIAVTAGEVYRAIREPLEEGISRARALADNRRVDRVVLSGQSSRIPITRWMFSRPLNEGGLGIPPAKIEFDDDNAKTAVSKGACLLHVMRDTLVGFEVDIADFKANLLSDLFYLQVDGSRRMLFRAGSINDFVYVEDMPDGRSFPKFLSIFSGSETAGSRLTGQFIFDETGADLPLLSETDLPTHAEVLEWARSDRKRYVQAAARLLELGERERIAWMESTATPGTPERPLYRYFVTRNQNLYAVRDAGSGGKRLHELHVEEPEHHGLDPRENPFSGIH